MIRSIIAAFQWLDKRFPPVVVVTQEDYAAFKEQASRHEKTTGALRLHFDDQQARIVSLEKSVNAVKDALSKGGFIPKADSEKLRSDFIANGRMGQ